MLSGTVMEKTRVPLRTWFVAIDLLVNAKKSVSSHQLERDLNLTQKTAWYLAMRLRSAMEVRDKLLYGIVEADETYVGGKPKGGQRSKPGRGTRKTPVIGDAERGANVIAQAAPNVSGRELSTFLRKTVHWFSELVTDEFKGYLGMDLCMDHHTVKQKDWYVDGWKHPNTTEGFWSQLKRAW